MVKITNLPLFSTIKDEESTENNKDMDHDYPVKDRKKRNKIRWTKPTLAIAIPALVGAMTDPLLSLIDTAFVGQLPNSSVPLASLGACTSIFHLAFNAFRATTTATTSLVSEAWSKERYAGDKTQESPTKEVTVASIQFGLIAGFSILTILLSCSTSILSLMGISSTSPAQQQLYIQAKSYLKIRTLAAPFVLFSTVVEGVFRGYANTVIPLIASSVAAFVNLILDPLLMFGGGVLLGGAGNIVGARYKNPVLRIFGQLLYSMKVFFENRGAGLGISGAAGATAFSQLCAGSVLAFALWKKRLVPPLLPPKKVNGSLPLSAEQKKKTRAKRRLIWKSILKANSTMMLKQGSLLLAWAYATSRATSIGTAHVAAHQVALSLWLIFALIQDGAAVAAQVLMSQTLYTSAKVNDSSSASSDLPSTPAYVDNKIEKTKSSINITKKEDKSEFNLHQTSLVKYMFKFALFQSCIAAGFLHVLGQYAPSIFTNDVTVQGHLRKLMPILALQQPLISMTLVTEGLAVGGNQFGILALGTALSTFAAMKVLSRASSIQGIWTGGIVCLFVGRFLTALVGIISLLWKGKKTDQTYM